MFTLEARVATASANDPDMAINDSATERLIPRAGCGRLEQQSQHTLVGGDKSGHLLMVRVDEHKDLEEEEHAEHHSWRETEQT